MCQRAPERVVLHSLHNPSSNGVVDDVTHHVERRLLFSKHSLEAEPLPQALIRRPLEIETRVLFGRFDERKAVGIILRSLCKEVNVVWHEAVHGNCELLSRHSTHELIDDECDM